MSTFNKQFLVRTGVNLPVGTSTSAPLTFQQGVNLTNLATGSVEWDGYNLYVTENSTTDTTSSNPSSLVRRTIAYVDSTLLSKTTTNITAAGTNQIGATVITTDHAFIETSTANAAPYNGVTLPPAILGRMVRIVNASANTINIYPLPVVGTVSGVTFVDNSNVINVSSTAGLYPGMIVNLTAGDGGGTIPVGSKIVSINSSTAITIDARTSGQITANGTVSAGSSTKINTNANNAPYLMASGSGVEFVADGSSGWYTVAISTSLGGGNTSPLGGLFAPGDVVYSVDASGNNFDGIAAEIIGKALISNGINSAPTYGKIQLDQTLTTADTNKSHVQGILPVLNGGTGTAGTALQAASTSSLTYDIVTAANVTTVNLGTSANNVYIGGSSTNDLVTVNKHLTVSGNLTVNGTTTTVNSTVTTLDDPILTLGGDTAPTSDDNKDRGIEFNWHNGTSAKVGFFGWDDSAGKFIFLSDASNISEAFSSTGDSTNYFAITPAATGNNVVLSTEGTDTDISLDINPKGAGNVNLNADTIRVGDSNSAVTLISNGTGALTVTTGGSSNLVLNTNNGTTTGSITIASGTNGDITIATDGTGDVFVNADTLRVGDSGATANITSNGAGNLVLSTNSGSNSGTITIANGVDGNITLAPNGTGDVYVDADTLRVGDSNAAATIVTNGSGALTVTTGGLANLTLSTNNGTNSGTILINNGVNGNIELAPNGSGDIYLTSDTVRVGDLNATATVTSNGTGDLVLNTNSGSNSGAITIAQGTNGNITLEPNGTGDVYLNADTIRVGDAASATTITSSGAGALTVTTGGAADLTLSTNSGTNSGTITIANGADANITIAPNGAGDVRVDADTLRVGDAGAATTIISNGAGALTVTTGGAADLTLSTNSGTNSGTFTIANGVNGDITIEPNGTGNVNINADALRVGDTNSNATITTSGTGDLILNTNGGTNSASIAIQDGVAGDVIITPSSTGTVKLSVSPPQTATSTEVVTAEWVINRTTAVDTVSIDLSSTNANQLVDAGFNWGVYRSAKYIIQVTQNGANGTRTQSSEILVTHDAPFTAISGLSSISTSIAVSNTSGLYEGMTVEVVSGIGQFQTGTTISVIVPNVSITVSATPDVALDNATIKAYLSGNYVSAAGATNNGATITVGDTAKLYPGMSISVTSGDGSFPANTYVQSITDDTTFVASAAPSVALSNSAVITGVPNVYITEYAVVETNGTACLLTADVTTTNVVLKASPQTWTAGLGTTINIGTIARTIFKGERQLIELR